MEQNSSQKTSTDLSAEVAQMVEHGQRALRRSDPTDAANCLPDALALLQRLAAELAQCMQERDDLKVWHATYRDAALAKGNNELVHKLAETEDRLMRVLRGQFAQICSYCGLEIPAGESSWETLQAHIRGCAHHPLPKAEARVAELEAPGPFTREEVLHRADVLDVVHEEEIGSAMLRDYASRLPERTGNDNR